MTVLAGVDGAGAGWVAVFSDLATGQISARYLRTAEIPAVQCAVLAIDVPIGLPDAGQRRADMEARALLGRPRRSSVFPPPIRPALSAGSREEACAITQAADGRRVGVQTWAIVPKIAAIDRLLREDADLLARTYEVHPEVSFATWGTGPMFHRKKSSAGRQERQGLIARSFGPQTFNQLYVGLPRHVAPDDLADAMAALWTAIRIHAGVASHLPDEDVLDAAGLPMKIWY